MRISCVASLWGVLIGAAVAFALVEKPPQALPADVLKALTDGTDFKVIGVDPNYIDAVPAGGWKVLRQNVVADAGARQKTIEAVKKSVADGTDSASCFIPRHAVAVAYEKKQYVLVICFQCSEMLIFVDGQRKGELAISAAAKESLDKILDGP